jgi:hypothetical protein
MVASAEGHLELCRWLVKVGVDLLAVSRGGFTALTYAARGGHVQICSWLLKVRASVKASVSHSLKKECISRKSIVLTLHPASCL